MEVVRERFAAEVTGVDQKGHAIVGPERKVGATERFEFNMPGDELSAVVGGGYISNWNADFLQAELGKDGTCARFYFDRKTVVDIADPESDISKKKRKLLFRHGFGYLCIPPKFSKDENKLRGLYEIALQEYYAYDKKHPRAPVVQEAVIVDSKGTTRRALMTAIDTRVGGGITGNAEKQAAELKAAEKMTKKESKEFKMQIKLRRRLRHSIQSGTPFRNPFVAKNRRLFNVDYATVASSK